MITQGDRYIGGGKIYFTPNKSGAVEVEIGEIQEAKISTSVTFADAMNRDRVMKTLVEKVAKEVTSTLSFTTLKVNPHNLAMFMLGTEGTEDFTAGDTLPDGTVAAADVSILKIEAGTNPIIEGTIRFVGDEDGAKKPVLVCDSVVITPTGDLPMIVDEFATLGFEGAVLADENGVLYREYVMEVGA